MKAEPIPVHVIWGTAPESDFVERGEERVFAPGQPVSRPLEVEVEKDAADYFVMRGVMAAFQTYVGQVKPGGAISVIISRGMDVTEQEPSPVGTSASFVINNPDGRHVWDFNVERRKAVR